MDALKGKCGEPETIGLRSVRDGDEDFLRFVYAESRREELDQVVWPEGVREQFLRSQFDAQASHYAKHYPGAEYLIIEQGGKQAGRLYIWRSATEILILDIALVREFRNRGIGTTLLMQIIGEGEASSRIVSIHVEKFNRALRLYERLGFRVVDDLGVYWFLHRPPTAHGAENRFVA
jgi:ribosomal protein S18 acetylase RimI-like enzyme